MSRRQWSFRKAGIRFITLSRESQRRASRGWRPVKEYDIFVPLSFNDGTPIPAEKFQALQEAMLDHFGGLTFFPQPNKGFWRMGGVTYRDEIVIYRVIASAAEDARAFLEGLKQRLKARAAARGNPDRRARRSDAVTFGDLLAIGRAGGPLSRRTALAWPARCRPRGGRCDPGRRCGESPPPWFPVHGGSCPPWRRWASVCRPPGG